MSKTPFAKGVKETRSAGLRYTLPDQVEVALNDLKLSSLADLFYRLLQAPDRPFGLLPTLAEAMNFLAESVDLVTRSLEEEHYLAPELNPEVSSSGQITPREESVVEVKGTGSRRLGLSPRDEADEVAVVSHPSNSGQPESTRTQTKRRVLMQRKEPLTLHRFLVSLGTALADFSMACRRQDPTISWNFALVGHPWKALSEGTSRSEKPNLRQPRSSTIAALAALSRKLRREKAGGPASQGKRKARRKNSS